MTGFFPRHLSVSAVQTYVTCPAAWKARYIDRLVQPSNPPMLFGKAFHAALEAEHKGADSERALIAAWNIADADLAASGQAMHPGKAHGLDLLNVYRERGLGGALGQPERKFVLALPSSKIPVPVLGFIDLPIPERRRFREFKTTGTTSWTDVKIQTQAQLHVYGWAYQQLYHHRVVCAEYVIFRTDIVQVDVFEAVPSADGFRAFEFEAEATWRGITDGNFEGCGKQGCDVCRQPLVEKASNGPSFTWDEATS
jgi:hypothetical protein